IIVTAYGDAETKRRALEGGAEALLTKPIDFVMLRSEIDIRVERAARARRAAMQQVADWLEKLGLGQYAQRFAENDVSFAVLPDLTDQDLKEIGVSLGHRRQLLRAIAGLKGAPERGTAVAAPVAPHDT